MAYTETRTASRKSALAWLVQSISTFRAGSQSTDPESTDREMRSLLRKAERREHARRRVDDLLRYGL